MSAHPIGKMQRDKGIVVHLHPHTPLLDLCVDLRGLAKKHQGLVNQMTPQVVKQAAGLFGST